MIIKADKVADLLDESKEEKPIDPLVICPMPDRKELRKSGSASIDLRLGTWFVNLRQARMSYLEVRKGKTSESKLSKTHYVSFGTSYYLHPRCFVLGVTLEWLRLPGNIAGYLTGRSSWGRRGLIIATAVGVHPGFTGCLTLELSNVGEIPVELKPGMTICQLFLHHVDTEHQECLDESQLVGQTRPIIPEIKPDTIAKKLAKPT